MQSVATHQLRVVDASFAESAPLIASWRHALEYLTQVCTNSAGNPPWHLEKTNSPVTSPEFVIVADEVRIVVSAGLAATSAEFDGQLALVTREQLAKLADGLAESTQSHSSRMATLEIPCERTSLHRALASSIELARYRQQAHLAERLLAISMALNRQQDAASLLNLILQEARAFTRADAGSVYQVDPEKGLLHFVCAQNDSIAWNPSAFTLELSSSSLAGRCALEGKSIRVSYHESGEHDGHDSRFDTQHGYQTRSILTVPMRLRDDTVIGVIQLINAKRGAGSLHTRSDFDDKVVGFSARSEEILNSLASLGATALHNVQLLQNIEQLFRGFVSASVRAIEQRDPTTSGHSLRVAQLTLRLAQNLPHAKASGLAGFTSSQLRELEYAALLHDFGKVGVREHILGKSKKINADRFDLIEAKFEHLRTAKWRDFWQRMHSERVFDGPRLSSEKARLQQELAQLQANWSKLESCNEPQVMADHDASPWSELGHLCYRDASERLIHVLEPQDLLALAVEKGSLTEPERQAIQAHVVYTLHFLQEIPWGSALRRVPEIASKHHEYLDGSGYPLGLHAQDIPVQSRILTICDVFDALTASDRPYKRSLPTERALDILQQEAKRGRMDVELLEVFIASKSYHALVDGGG